MPFAPPSPTPSADPRPVPYRRLFTLFLASRAIIYAIAAVGLLGVRTADGFVRPSSVLDWFVRWDATYYLDIAAHGYRWSPAAPTNVGFFPLLPWLIRAASLNGMIDARVIGYLISVVALWVAGVLLWKLVEREWHDANLATTAVAFLLFNPVSFFFTAIYSESLFLACTIACLTAARKNAWLLAAVFGGLAALTRYVGLVLVVPLAWQWLTTWRTDTTVSWRISIGRLLACLGPVFGYAVYCGVMWAKFGNPFMYSVANEASGRHFTWFWGLFARPSFTGQPLFYQIWFAGTVVVAFLVLLGGVLLRLGPTYSMYVLAFSFVYISARFVDSLPRYFAGLFPLYIAVALIVRRWPYLRIPLLTACIALGAVSVVLFVNGYWFT